jgi:single-strand DNA-binding protein
MNNINLIGRLTRDPELRELKGGETVLCAMRIAIDNAARGGGRGEPTYVDVACFGAQAKACAGHLAKGRQVAVSGRLVFREWAGRDGRRRSAHSVQGKVDFLGSPAQAGGEPEEELRLAV